MRRIGGIKGTCLRCDAFIFREDHLYACTVCQADRCKVFRAGGEFPESGWKTALGNQIRDCDKHGSVQKDIPEGHPVREPARRPDANLIRENSPTGIRVLKPVPTDLQFCVG